MTFGAPQILRAANRVATPWKNGLGVTREIAADPPGADLDGFDWRISTASVDAGGPFSIFPRVDRILAVLDGRLALRIDGRAPVELDPDTAPLAFPGDIPVEADLLAGPVTDLNVMVRRGRFEATLERLRLAAPVEFAVSPTTVILARTAGVDVIHLGRRHTLERGDAIRFDRAEPEPVRLEPSGPSSLFVIRLTACRLDRGARLL